MIHRALPVFFTFGLCLLPSCADDAKADPKTGDESKQARTESRKTAKHSKSGAPEDESIETWRTDLLDLAFRSVSKIPLDPLIKDRGKWQAFVVDACLDLAQPARAIRYAKEVPNWRKYRAYADYAFHCASSGHVSEVQRYLDLARAHADEMARNADTQAWRRDSILRGIARAQGAMGELQNADATAGMTSDAAAALGSAWADNLDDDAAFQALLGEVDAALKSNKFEQIKAGLETCVELFDRFYQDSARRMELERRVTMDISTLPPQLCVERALDLCAAASNHGAKDHVLRLVKHAQLLLDGTKWLPDTQVQFMAKVAGHRARAGDEKRARTQLAAAYDYFEKNKEVVEDGRTTEIILNFDRVEALLPIAEAWHALRDAEMTAKAYAIVVEASAVNPNARPRAEDFAQICCSMAAVNYRPDAKLLARMKQIASELEDPW